MILKTDGSLWAAGRNDRGQLGDGTYVIPAQPVRVATEVVAVAAGYQSSLFIKADATLWAMGDNSSGQLGISSTGYVYTAPTPVRIATGVASASIGDGLAFFVKTDATLWAMGNNYNGRLGDGTTTGHSTPVQISGGMAQASVGRLHSAFITVPTAAPASFAAWSATFGLTGSASVGEADPDGDGTPNLIEYVFATSPVLAHGSAASVPTLTTGTIPPGGPGDGEQAAVILTHRRRKAVAASIVYQASSNLADPGDWTPVVVTPVVVDPDADGDGLVETVSVTVPLPTGADARLFLRLSVTSSESPGD